MPAKRWGDSVEGARAQKRPRIFDLVGDARVPLSSVVRIMGVAGEKVRRASLNDQLKEALLKDTSFGPLLCEVPVPLAAGGHTGFTFVHPLGLVERFLDVAPAFAEAIAESLVTNPCSVARPWNIVFYADKATPGNLLKTDNRRASLLCYWSFEELGPERLSRTHSWMLGAVVRADDLKLISGGLSAVTRVILESFFQPYNIAEGVSFVLNGRRRFIFARIGTLLFDEEALHEVMCSMGASGTKPCCLCSNAVSTRSQYADVSDAFTCVDDLSWDDCRLHSNHSILGIVDHLARQSRLLGVGRFRELQTELGFKHAPTGILSSPVLRKYMSITSAVTFDYLHVVLVCGLFQTELWMFLWWFLERVEWADIDVYVKTWRWPKCWGTTAKNMFNEKRKKACFKASTFKAGASEALALYEIFRRLVLERLRGGEDALQVRSLRCLFRIMDAYRLMLTGSQPSRFLNCARDHAEAFTRAYGDYQKPQFKHHMMLHLGFIADNHPRRGRLPTALTHERKHRAFKDKARSQENDKSFNVSLTKWLLGVDAAALIEGSPMITGDRLIRGAPNPKMARQLGLQQCHVSRVMSKRGLRISMQDVLLCRVGSEMHAFMVHACVQADSHPVLCDPHVLCAKYSRENGIRWAREGNATVLVPSSSILDVAIWRPAPGPWAGPLPHSMIEVLLPGSLAYNRPGDV